MQCSLIQYSLHSVNHDCPCNKLNRRMSFRRNVMRFSGIASPSALQVHSSHTSPFGQSTRGRTQDSDAITINRSNSEKVVSGRLRRECLLSDTSTSPPKQLHIIFISVFLIPASLSSCSNSDSPRSIVIFHASLFFFRFASAQIYPLR